MNFSKYRITLDVHEAASQVQIAAKQNDSARQIYATLMENGKPYVIESGCRAVLAFERPGAEVMLEECDIRTLDSTIIYTFDEFIASIEGLVECELRLLEEDTERIITSPRFTILVNDNIYDDGDPHGISTKDIIDLQEKIIDSMEGIQSNTEEGRIAGALAVKTLSEGMSVSFTKEQWAEEPHSGLADGQIVNITDDYVSNICETVSECTESRNPNDVAGASAVAEFIASHFVGVNPKSFSFTTALWGNAPYVGLMITILANNQSAFIGYCFSGDHAGKWSMRDHNGVWKGIGW